MRRLIYVGLVLAGPDGCRAPRGAATPGAGGRLRGCAADHRRHFRTHRVGRAGRAGRAHYRGRPERADDGACGRDARGPHREDRHADAGQRARAHRLRGLHELGREELHGRERPRSSAARGVLRRRRDAVGRQQSDRSVDRSSRRIRQAGKFPAASRFFFMPGMAPPNGGPDAILMKGTDGAAGRLRGVDRGGGAGGGPGHGGQGAEERQDLGRRSARHVSEDDARGLQRDHRRSAQASDAGACARDRAGRSEGGRARRRRRARSHRRERDSSTTSSSSLLREKKPYWTTVIGLGDRSEVCNHDPFVDQNLSARRRSRRSARRAVRPLPADGRERERDPGQQRAEDDRHRSAPGARHRCRHRRAACVRLGRSPRARALGRARRVAGRGDRRRHVAPRGAASASRIWGRSPSARAPTSSCSTANPLDDIRNTRQIDKVYIKGAALDRQKMAAEFRNKE